MDVRVISSVGAYLCNHGSRKVGEVFEDLTEELALELVATYPSIFELVAEERPEEQE